MYACLSVCLIVLRGLNDSGELKGVVAKQWRQQLLVSVCICLSVCVPLCVNMSSVCLSVCLSACMHVGLSKSLSLSDCLPVLSMRC